MYNSCGIFCYKKKKISKQKAKRCKKKTKERKSRTLKEKEERREKNSEVLAFFLVPLLSCMHCLLELDLIQV